MRHKNIVLKVCEWGLFLIILLLFVAIVSPLLPTKKFFASYAVISGSMEPTIHTGSIAFIQPAQADTLKNGSIIAFSDSKDPRVTILHRIVNIETHNEIIQYKTKGDANNAVDDWTVQKGQILGTYTFAVPYIGYLTGYVRQPIGFTLLIGLPALMLLFIQIKSIKEGFESEVKKRVLAQQQADFNLPKLFVLLLGITLISAPPIQSLLNSTATLTGLTIGTKETFSEVSLNLLSGNKHVEIVAEDLQGYESLTYTLSYDTNSVSQGVMGEKVLDGDESFSKTITLGTCSEEDCVYHVNPHNFNLSITLLKNNGEEVTITKSL